jgi:hypothetical protein
VAKAMKIHIRGLILLLALLVVSGTALAAAAAYRLDWYVLSGSGGGRATSSKYQLGFTVGQAAAGAASSANYRLIVGYWAGVVPGAGPGPAFDLYLPILLRHY